MVSTTGRFCQAVAFLLLACTTPSVSAFSPVSPGQAGKISLNRASTQLYVQTQSPPSPPPIKDISYGEESRKYRRTVFTHDDWVQFRSPDRFWRNVRAMFASGVYKNIGREVGATTTIATAIVIWNCLVSGFDDFQGNHIEALLQGGPLMSMPLTAFTLTSPALGLLLGKCLPWCRFYVFE